MWTLRKTFEISASHCLDLPYKSKCQNIHGHNWKIIVEIKSSKLNDNQMVIDFSEIKKLLLKFDHTDLGKIFINTNSTCENMAQLICHLIQEEISKTEVSHYAKCTKVTVIESEGNEVTYENI